MKTTAYITLLKITSVINIHYCISLDVHGEYVKNMNKELKDSKKVYSTHQITGIS